MPGYLPSVLAQLQRYCGWKIGSSPNGKPTKIPDQSTLDLSRCRPWLAVEAMPRDATQGVGLIFTNSIMVGDQQLLAIDLDACRNPRTGALSQWACELQELLGNPWAQLSPSMRGFHIFGLVRPQLLRGLRAHGHTPFAPALNCGDKKTDLQLFTNHGYLSITLLPVPSLDCAKEIDVIPDALILRMIERFALQGREDTGVKLQVGEGDVPTLDEIGTKICARRHGTELVCGKWKDVVGEDKSASEAFFMLEGLALEAARFHMQPVVEFLLQRTAWGRGEIEDSKDPGKYTRRPWVNRDVASVAGRWKREADPIDSFEVLPLTESMKELTETAKQLLTREQSANGKHEEPKKEEVDSIEETLNERDRLGPIVHLPTGIESLDALTGGGFVLGSRVYINGAPDAWKTGLGVQIIDEYLKQGISCAILGVDEERMDLLGRLLQRRGASRAEVEAWGPTVRAKARQLQKEVPLLLLDPDTTIDDAALKLYAFACKRHPGVDRPPCVLLTDSVQTARCKNEVEKDSLYTSVTQRSRTIRAAASKCRMLTITTSEMSRAAYKHKKKDDQIADLASAKESGAIEYSARVLIALHNVPGTHDVIELRIAKNKHGPIHRDDQKGIFLRVDRETQTLREDSTFEPVDPQEEVEEERKERLSQKRQDDVVKLGQALIWRTEPMSVREAAREMKVHHDRVSDARAHLKELGALVEVAGPRGAVLMTLLPDKLPEGLRAQMLL